MRTLLAMFALTVAAWGVDEWRPVKGGILGGLSDLALVEHNREHSVFLCVHDNKNPKEPRVGLVVIPPRPDVPVEYRTVDWQFDPETIDLESISTLPGRPREFLALISRGTLFHLRLSEDWKRLETVGRFLVPNIPPAQNFEGLSVQKVDNRLVMAWADRGEQDRAATLFWGELRYREDREGKDRYEVRKVKSVGVQVPWPRQNVRHISEMKIDETGTTFIAAASDPGDDGPFESAIYLAGVFHFVKDEFTFHLHPRMLRLRSIHGHKIEALELVPGDGGVVMGTDDENFGGWVSTSW
jgi:hypothetical protein